MSKRTLVILFVILVVSVLLLFVFQAKAKPTAPASGNGGTNNNNNNNNTSGSNSSTSSMSPVFPLKKGDKGTAVKMLQILVGVTPDGDWGDITDKAIQSNLGTTSITKDIFVAKCIDAAATDPDFPLTVGENSNYIQALQALLDINIDGTWGSEMTAAIKDMVSNNTVTAADYIRIAKGTLSNVS